MAEVYRSIRAIGGRSHSRASLDMLACRGLIAMLDVHAPDHEISGLRGFLLHMLTITLGLLIALALENVAEDLHHRHQRKEAEANIRQELENYRDELKSDASIVIGEADSLARMMTALQTVSAGTQLPKGHIDLTFHETPIPDAAWRTASSTGVLAYMEYGEVERFAAAYKQQDMLEKAEEDALEDYLQFLPLLKNADGDIKPENAKETLPLVRRAYGHVAGMLDIGRGTLQTYDEALK